MALVIGSKDYTVAGALNTVMDRHAALANSFRVHKISETACYSVVSCRSATERLMWASRDGRTVWVQLPSVPSQAPLASGSDMPMEDYYEKRV